MKHEKGARRALLTNVNLLDYFLTQIMNEASSSLSETGQVYIAQLLVRMINPQNFHQYQNGKASDKPFAIQLLEALNEPNNLQRGLMLQRIGDVSLYYSSFYRPKITVEAMNLSYYQNLGRQAYLQAAALRRSDGVVLREVATKFERVSSSLFRIGKLTF